MSCIRIVLITVVLFATRITSAAGPALPTEPLRALPDPLVAKVRVHPDEVVRPVSPVFIGNNLHPGSPREKLITDEAVQRRVRRMGVKSLRFPNGCVADLYDWQNPSPYTVTVEAFLDFCEAVRAEAYYTLNMQGGTDGLEGPVPDNANIEERIRYRHKAPNPCGNTNYHFGTLAEALALFQTHTVERALAGKLPITHYELGNENWGQAKTDWPPEVYGKTCEVYATALRKALADAQARHSELAQLRLYIVAVGFPSMGNNQDPFRATDRDINVAWTSQINRLADLGLIDAVQEHFYPYGGADGSTLLWTVHNLHNILALRHGEINPRLGGYADPELAYRVPLEWTEWNVKCWGPLPRIDLPLKNPDFENELQGWRIEALPPGLATASTSKKAARRGENGLLLATGGDAQHIEARQTFSVADRLPAAAFGAAVWVRTPVPLRVHLILRQVNDGPNMDAVLGERVATQTDMWERQIVMAVPSEDTREIELILRLEGENAVAWLDEVQIIHWPTFSGVAPLVATRFEQQLFIVDALRTLLEWPTPRTHIHHLIGNYPCPTLSADGSERDNFTAFKFLHRRIGDEVVRTECDVATFDHNTYADEYASDFNALAPDMKDVPALSALTTRDGDRLFILLVNRTSDRTVQAEIEVAGPPLQHEGEVRTLAGSDFDVVGARITNQPLEVANPLKHAIPPHAARVLTLRVLGPAE